MKRNIEYKQRIDGFGKQAESPRGGVYHYEFKDPTKWPTGILEKQKLRNH